MIFYTKYLRPSGLVWIFSVVAFLVDVLSLFGDHWQHKMNCSATETL